MATEVEFHYTLPWDREGRWRPRTATIRLEHPDPDDLIARRIRETRCFYEIDLLEYIAVRGPSGGTFVDVGANIGNHAVYFGKFLADFVLAIEPAAAAADALEKNLSENDITACRVLRCGAGAQAGLARAVVEPTNLGATRLSVGAGGTVPLTTLDEILRDLPGPPVRFLKIDVEGMELDVLRGARELLEQQKPQLCVELMTRPQYEAAEALLRGLGYRPLGHFCATPTYYFADPAVHPRRHRPAWPLYRLLRSWQRGALSRKLRRRQT